MSDIIALLPDAVANQIAAGEVVQRPASVVKELLENAVDAGATDIRLIVKDAGKTLVQVMDNGCGMSPKDAELAFERHATSKIKKAEDLFAILTKGFRGEALASIAAIAQVELKTRDHEDEVGTLIRIAASTIDEKQPCQCPAGSSFAVKNLFFNIPARRNFLKSDPVETRHIIDEFQRVALTHPSIAFSMHHNGNEIFQLPAVALRQRVVNVMGNKFNQRLVPVEEHTDILTISGFVGKPEFTRKSRGEQFLFVNHRFIKSPFLHNAITKAFGELLPPGHHPSYFVYLNIDPAEIDVNIHPTKTEVKFQDERSVYAMLHSTVRRALGKFNVAPSLDFDQENSFQTPPIKPGQEIRIPQIRVNPEYNPFESGSKREPAGNLASKFKQPSASDWRELYRIVEDSGEQTSLKMQGSPETNMAPTPGVLMIHGTYAVTQIASGMVLIHVKRAQERIAYEKHLIALKTGTGMSQRLLFPQTLELSSSQLPILENGLEDLRNMGFELNELGERTFAIAGVPTGLDGEQPRALLEDILDQLEQAPVATSEGIHKSAIAVARSAVKRMKTNLKQEELRHLVDELFACEQPYYTPIGKPTIATFSHEEITSKFQ